ncbi:phage major capsid protein [Microcella alkalica]|uniref:phage major capsid protein n=1 Tax=Microcella alkalica TaxID=355930 RepID=UPI00145D3316|nr:phage major capsid protein [Microcella alkalica]
MSNTIQELRSIQAKLSAIVASAKATGRDLTEAEAAEIQAGSARAIELKAAIDRGEQNAELIGQVAALGSDSAFQPGPGAKSATVDGHGDDRGYLSADSIKSMTRTAAAPGVKALVAAGSSTSPVALESKPIPMGGGNIGLLSLVPTIIRDTPQYSYLRQSVRTNNADVVAAGATKPTSVFTVAAVPNELKVVAHLSEYVDKYLLEDNRDLESFLSGELQFGVLQKVTELALTAFTTASGIQSIAYTNSPADSIYVGADSVSELGYNPNLVIVNPADYRTIRLAKGSDQHYVSGEPLEGSPLKAIWGLTTLTTPGIPAGTALVLDTNAVSISVDRSGIVTEWDAISGFDSNRVRARTEGRFGFDVKSPAALALVDLTAA